jgi:hypothetical protein
MQTVLYTAKDGFKNLMLKLDRKRKWQNNYVRKKLILLINSVLVLILFIFCIMTSTV